MLTHNCEVCDSVFEEDIIPATDIERGHCDLFMFTKNGEWIDKLTIHRMGGRLSVFPRAVRALRRGLVPDADVVLEVFNGISFLTPLWLRLPRVTLIHLMDRIETVSRGDDDPGPF